MLAGQQSSAPTCVGRIPDCCEQGVVLGVECHRESRVYDAPPYVCTEICDERHTHECQLNETPAGGTAAGATGIGQLHIASLLAVRR